MNTPITKQETSSEETPKFVKFLEGKGYLDILMPLITITSILLILLLTR